MESKLSTISEKVNNDNKYSADLDEALELAGVGRYNVKYGFVLAMFLITAMLEVMGYSYILPAAKCDLNLSDSQRAILASLPYLGIVLTSYPWGYVLDTQGRKKSLIYSSLMAGTLGILAGFMPNTISFASCKFLASLCAACPAAAPYSYIGEIVPRKHRDLALAITNAMQIFGSALVPILAWGIIYPFDFRIDFGLYYFRPWRLLTITYPLLFILSALLLIPGPESPKYLVAQGRTDEAMKILQTMYSINKKRPKEDFPVKILKEQNVRKEKSTFLTSLNEQTLPVLKPPYGKWLALNGFLLMGTMAMLNGLFMWVPDIINRVLSGDQDNVSACQVISQRFAHDNTTLETPVCVDILDQKTFVINSIANLSCAVIAVFVSATIKFISKKVILVTVYVLFGAICVCVNFITNKILFSVLLTSLQLVALSIGCVNAFSVEIFPTNIRGMAVSLGMMLSRLGSVAGNNIAGAMITSHCEELFYTFGGWILLCGLLSMLLPKPAR